MLRRVLIANRGEIAVRIQATCHRLGIQTVLAASEADTGSLPARLADRVICIGPPPAAASYLNVAAVVAAAVATGAQAVHPGYGFLAENPQLARACEAAGLMFIGPTPAQLAAAGDKLAARQQAAAAGVPVLPGGQVSNAGEAAALAHEIGFPLLIKAAGGGGGRGLRLVRQPGELAMAAAAAMAEARTAFGDERIYLERFVTAARHVEVQVIGDGQEVVHAGDRDCSVQRRYQKVLEEAPAPGLEPGLRAALHAAAVAFGRQLRYRGVGTAEFLVEPARAAFSFLEFNARIQVEHPVTEAVTGLDLVAEQIAVAEGLPLRLRRGGVALAGHALECRINAEDWRHGFRPSPGTLTGAVFPAGPGIRTDTWVQARSVVPAFYDCLLAKVIAHGSSRAQALSRLHDALAACQLTGVATNLSLHTGVTRDPGFLAGSVDTGYLERFLARSGVPVTGGLAAGGGALAAGTAAAHG